VGELIPLGEWEAEAACRETPNDLYYPSRGDSEKAEFIRMFCELCPVRGECLGYALDKRERHGVWGGTTEKERRVLQRLLRKGLSVEQVVAMVLAGELDEEMAARRTQARRPRE